MSSPPVGMLQTVVRVYPPAPHLPLWDMLVPPFAQQSLACSAMAACMSSQPPNDDAAEAGAVSANPPTATTVAASRLNLACFFIGYRGE